MKHKIQRSRKVGRDDKIYPKRDTPEGTDRGRKIINKYRCSSPVLHYGLAAHHRMNTSN